MLDQQFGEDPDLSRGVLSRRPDNEHAAFGERIARHHGNQGAGSQIIFDEEIRKCGDAEPRRCGDRKGRTIIRLESSLRMNGDRPVSIDEPPGFRPLHERLVREQFVRRVGSSMLLNIVWARDKLSIDRSDAARDQVRVTEIADPYRAVETLTDDVDETITVARMHMKQRMSPRQLREHGRQMRWAERQRR